MSPHQTTSAPVDTRPPRVAGSRRCLRHAPTAAVALRHLRARLRFPGQCLAMMRRTALLPARHLGLVHRGRALGRHRRRGCVRRAMGAAAARGGSDARGPARRAAHRRRRGSFLARGADDEQPVPRRRELSPGIGAGGGAVRVPTLAAGDLVGDHGERVIAAAIACGAAYIAFMSDPSTCGCTSRAGSRARAFLSLGEGMREILQRCVVHARLGRSGARTRFG